MPFLIVTLLAVLEMPVAVAVSEEGTVYWAESGSNRVCRISPGKDLEVLMKGPRRRSAAIKLTEDPNKPVLGRPSDLLLKPDGTLLVADPVSHRVWKLSNLK